VIWHRDGARAAVAAFGKRHGWLCEKDASQAKFQILTLHNVVNAPKCLGAA